MAYDIELADRVRLALGRGAKQAGSLREIRMFGGLCFTVSGHMCCGIVGRDLVVRVGPQGYPDALTQPHARPMDFTGRPLKGFVYVGPAGYRRSTDLAKWVRRGLLLVTSLPPKRQARRRRPQRPRRPA